MPPHCPTGAMLTSLAQRGEAEPQAQRRHPAARHASFGQPPPLRRFLPKSLSRGRIRLRMGGDNSRT